MSELISANGWDSNTVGQTFELDDVVSVRVDGGANSGKAYSGNHIRIYATDTPAGSLTIYVAEGYQLVSVKVSTVEGTYAHLCVSGKSTDIGNTTVPASGSYIVLNSVKNGSDGKQVRVTGIEVTYKEGDGGSAPPPSSSEYVETTFSAANALPSGTRVILKGTVTSIDTPWSDSTYCMSVTITNEIGKTFYVYKLATEVEVGDVISVKGSIGSYNGKNQIAAGATAILLDHVDIVEPETPEVSIPEAIALPDDTKVIVSGTVVEINTPWNAAYGNITVTIADEDGNTLYIYRLSTDVKVGDIITITGKMGSYNGAKQVAAGATAEITGHKEVEGPDYAEVSIPEAIVLPDETFVIVKGTVAEINTPWSDSYGNITVTIADEDGNTLYIYRLATNVEVGDIVTITGKVSSYNGAKQIISGTAEITGHVDPSETETTDPVETDPVETDPVETDPVETDPVETDPVETDPVETDPVETDPVETDPVETDPVETDPVETNPVETDPVETDPVETDPVETNPVETDPKAEQPTEAPAPTKEGGCKSSLTGGALMISVLCMGLVAVVFKKKED